MLPLLPRCFTRSGPGSLRWNSINLTEWTMVAILKFWPMGRALHTLWNKLFDILILSVSFPYVILPLFLFSTSCFPSRYISSLHGRFCDAFSAPSCYSTLFIPVFLSLSLPNLSLVQLHVLLLTLKSALQDFSSFPQQLRRVAEGQSCIEPSWIPSARSLLSHCFRESKNFSSSLLKSKTSWSFGWVLWGDSFKNTCLSIYKCSFPFAFVLLFYNPFIVIFQQYIHPVCVIVTQIE